jgi:hypothetical protein
MRRFLTLALVMLMSVSLTCCSPKPVQQGMVSADSLTFLAATITDEKAGTVTVTVTMTNGTTAALYLSAPELTTEGGTTAAYLDMTLGGTPSELSSLSPTGLTRWLHLDPRESYSETRTFTSPLPATLTVTVCSSPSYSGEFTETTVELELK